MKVFFKFLAAVTLLIVGTAAVRAENSPQEKKFYAGALIGANFPTGNFGTQVSPVYGLTAGVKLAPTVGLGFFGTYNGQYSSGNFLGLNAASTTGHFILAGEASLFLSYFHIGINVGAEIHNWTASAGGTTFGNSLTGFVFGPQAGVDIPLNSFITVGGEVHYLFTSLVNAQGNLIGVANVKFWFF